MLMRYLTYIRGNIISLCFLFNFNSIALDIYKEKKNKIEEKIKDNNIDNFNNSNNYGNKRGKKLIIGSGTEKTHSKNRKGSCCYNSRQHQVWSIISVRSCVVLASRIVHSGKSTVVIECQCVAVNVIDTCDRISVWR